MPIKKAPKAISSDSRTAKHSRSAAIVQTAYAFRAEFTDIRIRLKEAPDQLVVLTELFVRAARDPAIARILSYLDQGWRGHLISIFDAGIADKTFRSDLGSEATANSMMSQLRGLGYHSKLDPVELDALIDHIGNQIEHWVCVPAAPKKRRRKR